jgi:hypothetical protein
VGEEEAVSQDRLEVQEPLAPVGAEEGEQALGSPVRVVEAG